jgi:pimeloyl-ACP methyl ester carboxylesterase
VKSSRLFSAALLLLAAGAAGAAVKPIAQQGRSCHLPGTEEALRCVELTLPLDYANAGAGKQKLHVTVAPAYRESARPDPLFVLAGGPGQAGTDVLVLLTNTFRRVRATRDIVFIDQRGTGLSGKLDCARLPNEESMTEAQNDAAARACIAAVKQPFSAYSTANAARDIEQVRSALGYRSINLWGASYGTRLAQQYMRTYPASVRAAILDGVLTPEQVIPAGGRDGQAALELVFRQCAADKACNGAFPALRSEFASLSARVESAPVRLQLPDPRTARPLTLEMNSDRFLGPVHNILYSPLDARRLPFLIHSAYQGRWEPFVARHNAASDFSGDGPVARLMHMAVVCAEDLPRLTPQLRAADAAPLTAPMLKRLAPMCDMMKVPPVAARAPSAIAAPVLMLSGQLDPVTPPHRAEAAGQYMQKVQHLSVEWAGHGVSQLGCAPRLMREFLDQPAAPVDGACLKEIPAPTFQLGSAGPQP